MRKYLLYASVVVALFWTGCESDTKPTETVNETDILKTLQGAWISENIATDWFQVKDNTIFYPFVGENDPLLNTTQLTINGNKFSEIYAIDVDSPNPIPPDVSEILEITDQKLVLISLGENINYRRIKPTDNVQLFSEYALKYGKYAGKSASDLLDDGSFNELLQNEMTDDFSTIIGNMGGGDGNVGLVENRYLKITGSVKHEGVAYESILLFDLEKGKIFAATTDEKGKIGSVFPKEGDHPTALNDFVQIYQ